MPGPTSSPSTRWAGCSARRAAAGRVPATPSSPASTPGCRRWSSASCEDDHGRPADGRHGHRAELRGGLRRRRSCSTRTTVAWSRWPAIPTYDPQVWVGGISRQGARRLYTTRDPASRCCRGRPRPSSRPGSTFKPFMALGALSNGYTIEHPAELLVVVHGRQPRVQELRVRCATATSRSPGAAGLVQHVLLPGRLRAVARRGRRRRADGAPRTRWSRRPRRPGSVADRHRPAGRGERPDRRPALEACSTGRTTRTTTASSARSPAATSCTCSRASSASTATRYRAGDAVNFVDRPGRHDHHAAAAGRRLRARSPTAARSTRPGSARRSLSPDGDVVRRIKPQVAGPAAVPKAGRRVRSTRRCAARPADGTLALEDGRLPARRGADARQDRNRGGLRQADDVVAGDLQRGLRRRA